MKEKVLNGITWAHSRGLTPLLAVSQRYSELHPDIEIKWQKRSLQEFADYPLEKLVKSFDLLIIDHPWVGCAAVTQSVLPLDEYLPSDFLADQLKASVGRSHESYNYAGSQWALAIDAATPAASYRKDLFEKNQREVPQKWNELIVLAKEGKVALPAIPIDILMNFYGFCIAAGTIPFENEDEIIPMHIGLEAIEQMCELYVLIDRKMFKCNPIAVAELMTTTDDYWYCPFAYAYSNYSRTGYAKNVLQYRDVISLNGVKLKTTIGGTGIAVSSYSNHKEVALDFTSMAVSEICQRTMYVQHGGQPGHKSAWTDEIANVLTNNFFKEVLPLMENGYTRPRYNGYLFFQDHAGLPLQQCMMGEKSAKNALNEMNQLYHQSLSIKNATVLA